MKHPIRKLISGMLLALGMLCPLQASAEARLRAFMENIETREMPEQDIVKDNNLDPTALVVINSALPDLKFSNNVFRSECQTEDNGVNYIYYLYILDGSRKIEVLHDDYLYYELLFQSPLKGGEMTSGITIAGEIYDAETAQILNDTETYKVTIDYNDFSDLYVDNQKVEEGGTLYLEEGSHELTTRYKDFSYSPSLKVKPGENHVDALLSGLVVMKGASKKISDVNLYSIDEAPSANYDVNNSKGRTHKFIDVLGDYELEGYACTHAWVRKKIHVDKRSTNVFRLDEMVGYLLVMYHGMHLQPWGLNIGYVKDFGGFVSWSTDLRSSIKTSYGKVEFKEDNGDDKYHWTATTLQAGPMFKIVRKFYAQVGGGVVRYLRTSEPKVLTPGYKYKFGGAAGASLFIRVRNYMFGAGYTHQFVKSAYNPHIANQVTFTIGWAKGQ